MEMWSFWKVFEVRVDSVGKKNIHGCRPKSCVKIRNNQPKRRNRRGGFFWELLPPFGRGPHFLKVSPVFGNKVLLSSEVADSHGCSSSRSIKITTNKPLSRDIRDATFCGLFFGKGVFWRFLTIFWSVLDPFHVLDQNLHFQTFLIFRGGWRDD